MHVRRWIASRLIKAAHKMYPPHVTELTIGEALAAHAIPISRPKLPNAAAVDGIYHAPQLKPGFKDGYHHL